MQHGTSPVSLLPSFHSRRMKIPIVLNTRPIRLSTIGFPGNLAIEYNNKIAFVYPVYGKQNKASPSAHTEVLFVLSLIYLHSSHLSPTLLMRFSTLARQRAFLLVLFVSTVYAREEVICNVNIYFGCLSDLLPSVTSSVSYCEPPETLLVQQLDVVYFASNQSVFFNISAASVVSFEQHSLFVSWG